MHFNYNCIITIKLIYVSLASLFATWHSFSVLPIHRTKLKQYVVRHLAHMANRPTLSSVIRCTMLYMTLLLSSHVCNASQTFHFKCLGSRLYLSNFNKGIRGSEFGPCMQKGLQASAVIIDPLKHFLDPISKVQPLCVGLNPCLPTNITLFRFKDLSPTTTIIPSCCQSSLTYQCLAV